MALRVGRVALASVAGVTDAAFANRVEGVGLACLGGFSVDRETWEASREIAERGRSEFEGWGVEYVVEEIERCRIPSVANVRSVSAEPLVELARRGVAVEVNAHCRQPEMTGIGAGEALLREPGRLASWVEAVKDEGGVVGVKTRGNVVDDAALAGALQEADFLHVDAMGPPGRYDLDVIRGTRRNYDGVIIGNNSVRSAGDVEAMLEAGADAVSAARPALSEAAVFRELAGAVEGEVVLG